MPNDSPDANVALVDRFFDEVMNEADPTKAGQAAAQLLTPDFVAHHPFLPHGQGGAVDVAKLMATFRGAFPDLHYEVEAHVAQDDEVATRWVATGTHSNTFLGIAATGKHVSVTGTDTFRVAGGRLAETWVCSDMLGLMQQLGAFQAPGTNTAAPAPAGAAAGH